MDQFGQMLDAHTVVFERLLPGPIEKVFSYLWDGDKRGQWFCSGAMPTKPGEHFVMHFKHRELSPNKAPPPEKMKEMDEKGHSSNNTLIAYEPPTRLAFTFAETHPKGPTEVEFRLKPEGNQVRLILTHRKIPDRDFALGVSGGWHSHLEILEHKLKGEIPPAFWDVWRRYDGAYDKRYT